MPKIQEYQSTTSAAGPERQTAANIEDTGNTGTAIRNAAQSVQEGYDFYQRRKGQADIADQAAANANFHEELGQELADRLQNATPNDISGKNEDGSDGQSMTEKFSDYIDQKMQELPEPSSRAGREFAERQRAAIKQHLMISMVHGQSALEGANAVAQVKSSLDSTSNALNQDPTAFEMAKQNHSDYVDSMVAEGGLPAKKAAELKQYGNAQLAEGAARGYMQIDPDMAKKMIDNGIFDKDITSAKKYKLSQEADVHIRAKEVQANVQKKQQEDALKDVIQNTQNQMYDQMLSGKDVTKQIANDPNMNWQDKKQMLDIQAHTAKQRMATDPDVYNTLLSNIHADEGDPNKITDPQALNAYVGKGLSIPDRNRLMKEIDHSPEGMRNSAMVKGFMQMAKAQLVGPSILGKDPEGQQNLYNFQADFSDALQKGKQQGKTVAQMLSPTVNGKPNPDYLGSMLDQYRKTPQQIVQAQMNSMSSVSKNSTATPNAPAGIRVIDENGRPGTYKGTKEQAIKAKFRVIE